jgi:hypothetical protein
MGKRRWITANMALKVLCFTALILFITYPATAEDGAKATFEQYRQAIKKEHGIDIRNFKNALKGGRADGRAITRYDLKELMMGIKVELEHTTNKMLALEIATDHLEEYPDYYTRLELMEEEAERDLKLKGKK